MDDSSPQGLPILDSIICKSNGLSSKCFLLWPLTSAHLSVLCKLTITWPYQDLMTANIFSNLQTKTGFYGTITVIIYLQKSNSFNLFSPSLTHLANFQLQVNPAVFMCDSAVLNVSMQKSLSLCISLLLKLYLWISNGVLHLSPAQQSYNLLLMNVLCSHLLISIRFFTRAVKAHRRIYLFILTVLTKNSHERDRSHTNHLRLLDTR